VSLTAFLEDLRSRGIELRADGDQLRCAAPEGSLTPELRDQLQLRKNELLGFLRSATACAGQQRAIVPLQPNGSRIPVFAVAGHNGDVFCFRALARHLGDDQPFFGLQPPGLDGDSEPLRSVEALADYFTGQICAIRLDGPCIIAGYCAGGTVAFELARQLAQLEVAVHFVALFGSPNPNWYRFVPQFQHNFREQMARLRKHVHSLAALSNGERLHYFSEKLRLRRLKSEASQLAEAQPDPVLARRSKVEAATIAALRRYTPRYFPGDMRVFQPSPAWQDSAHAALRWQSSTARHLVEHYGPDDCTGDIMLLEPNVSAIADLFRQCCDNHTRA
jgi:thioesterase domain-containing protein